MNIEQIYQETLAIAPRDRDSSKRMAAIAEKYGMSRRELWQLRYRGPDGVGLCPETREPHPWEIELVEKRKAAIVAKHLVAMLDEK